MKSEQHMERLVTECAQLMLAKARKHVISRKGVVLVAAYMVREALDSLSPDERATALEDVRRVMGLRGVR